MKKQADTVTRKLIVGLLMLSIFLVGLSMVTPMASAATPSITVTPSQGASGSSVNVTGTGFAANTAVGIGFGAEVAVASEQVTVTLTRNADGTYTNTATLAKTPIKPGTYSMIALPMASTRAFNMTDDAAGMMNAPITASAFISGTLNYVTGALTYRTTISDLGQGEGTEYDSGSYTAYAYNVSPAAGITTSAQGSFTANITAPAVANGNYAITAIDSGGSVATATLNVIPEVLPFGAVLLLSSVAVVAGSWHFRKRPKIVN